MFPPSRPSEEKSKVQSQRREEESTRERLLRDALDLVKKRDIWHSILITTFLFPTSRSIYHAPSLPIPPPNPPTSSASTGRKDKKWPFNEKQEPHFFLFMGSFSAFRNSISHYIFNKKIERLNNLNRNTAQTRNENRKYAILDNGRAMEETRRQRKRKTNQRKR